MSLSPTPSIPQSTIDDYSRISDHDVAVLHKIVTRAQQIPGAQRLPFRALFTAYEEVLTEEGLDPDHDPIYFRFLFRLGDVKLSRLSLYEKFEEALAELGIRLEVDAEGEEHSTGTKGTNPAQNLEGALEKDVQKHPVKPNRRASISSLYERRTQRSTSPKSTDSSRLPHRPQSASSIRLEKQIPLAFGADGLKTQNILDEQFERLHCASKIGVNTDELLNAGSNLAKDKNPISAPGLLSALSRQHLPQNELTPQPQRSYNGQPREDPPEFFLLRDRHHQRNESDLIIDAQSFYHHHIFVSIRRIFRSWRSKALVNQRHHRTLITTAGRRDRTVLLEAGFGNWQLALQSRKCLLETEDFFSNMEQRAIRTRDLYLLTKAFSHWTQCTSDELLRTSVARRHLLRAKFFSAWKEGTGINELKVRKHILGKFLAIWKQRSAKASILTTNANEMYGLYLLRLTYWRWFWSFCEERAPSWWAGKAKWRVLIFWIQKVKNRREREGCAYGLDQQKLQKNSIHMWSQKVSHNRVLHDQASCFRNRTVLKRLLNEWITKARLTPLARSLYGLIARQRLNRFLQLWAMRWRMEVRAEELNCGRIIQRTWAIWNDSLRCKALTARIEDRLVLQALYKWVLVARCKLQQRVTDRRLELEVFSRIFQKQDKIRKNILENERILQDSKNRRYLTSAMSRWRQKMQWQRHREKVGLALFAPRIGKVVFQIWTSELSHLRLLERWAADASFYILSVHSLKKWRTALADSRKQRRREAYSYVRRKTKLRLATKTLSVWHQRYMTMQDMQVASQKCHSAHIIGSCIQILAVWRKQAEHNASLARKADVTVTTNILFRHTQQWTQRTHQQAQHMQQAEYFEALQTSRIAAGLLRKFSIRVFEFLRWYETANSLQERNQRRRFRNILRYWAEASADRKVQRGLRLEQPKTPNIYRGTARKPWKSSRWTVSRPSDRLDIGSLDADSSVLSTITPFPGYLTTPSKRAVRARILTQTSSTPLAARSTPFQHRLKSQFPLRGKSSSKLFPENGRGEDDDASTDISGRLS